MSSSNQPHDPHEIPDWANPELVYKKARQLESIPFDMLPGIPFSEESRKRIKELEQKIRDADARDSHFQLNLVSTVLKYPLQESWPIAKEEEEESDVEYILADTEEEWFEWKRQVDEKRAKKAALKESTLRAVSKSEHKHHIQNSGFPLSQNSNKDSSQKSESRFPLVERTANADAVDDVSTFGDKGEMEWNDDSLEQAPQSTPWGQNKPIIESFNLPRTPPPRQLASPPTSGLDIPVPAHWSLQQTPTRHSRRERVSHSQVSGSAKRDANGSPDVFSGIATSIVRSSSLHSLPMTPKSPKKLLAANRFTLLESTPPHSREGLDGSPLFVGRKGDVSRLSPTPFTLSQASFSQNPQSPTTTAYLYGSQENSMTPCSQLEHETVDPYAQELDEQIQIAPEFYWPEQSHRPLVARAHTWDYESQDDPGVSQQTRAISEWMGDDLGDVYRDEVYAAFQVTSYDDPYA